MPTKKVPVRDHDRRKPHQDEHIHVDFYVRTEEVKGGAPAGEHELGHHGDIDKETELVESIQRELGEDSRTCEICGKDDMSKNMTKLPGGEWLCGSCNKGEFGRSGDEYDCERVEETALWLLGLDDYSKFDEVPGNILALIKCPHCGERDFTVYAETEDLCMGGVDIKAREIEAEDYGPEEGSHYLCCGSCHENLTSDDVLASTLRDAVRAGASHARP